MPAVDLVVALAALVKGIAREQFRDPRALSDDTVGQLIVGLAGPG
jgi:hypothetical protein